MKIAPVLVVLHFLLVLTAARATTLTVAPDGSGDHPTIEAAVGAAAMSGDTILLLTGTFRGPGNRDVDNLGKGFTIRGEGSDPAGVVIDCEGSAAEPHRFLHIQGHTGAMLIEGITVTGGYAGGNRIPGGGALVIENESDASIMNCVFADNHADLTWDNAAGAVYIDDHCDPAFTDCVFRENSGYFGGAVGVNHFSHATFMGCVFLDNTGGRGGAIWGNSTTKVACLLAGNTAEQGGAVWGNGYNAEVSISCTYVRNGSPLGGAIYAGSNYGSPVQLAQTIIAFCDEGAGIWAGDGVPLEIACSDLYGNAGGDWIGNLAGLEDTAGNFGADPCFCDLDAGDLHLCADSLCLPGHHPWGCDELVGARGVGCAECECSDIVATQRRSLGAVKELFRR